MHLFSHRRIEHEKSYRSARLRIVMKMSGIFRRLRVAERLVLATLQREASDQARTGGASNGICGIRVHRGRGDHGLLKARHRSRRSHDTIAQVT
jgi:hypothetical protein